MENILNIILSFVFIISAVFIVIFLYINKRFMKFVKDSEQYLAKLEKENLEEFRDEKERLIGDITQKAKISKRLISLIHILNRDYGIFTISTLLVISLILYIIYVAIPSIDFIYNLLHCITFYINDIIFNFTDINIVNFIKLHNKGMLKLFEFANNSVGIIMSVSLTLYFFTFRVRRTISISSNTVLQDSLSILLFIFVTFIYGKLIIIFDESEVLFSSGEKNICLLIWLILYITSIKLGLSNVIVKMLKSVDLKYILDKTHRSAEHIVILLCYPKNPKDSEESSKVSDWIEKISQNITDKLFLYLSNCMESIYQTLSLSIEKNVGDVFLGYINNLEEFLLNFMHGYKKRNLRNFVPYIYLKSINHKSLYSLYATILDNHVSLITTLYNNGKTEEAEKCLELFSVLNPSKEEHELFKKYVKSLRRLINNINEEHPKLLKITLGMLRDFSVENREEYLGLQIYQDVLLQAVEEDDVTKMSRLVYSMLDSIEEEFKTSEGYQEQKPEEIRNLMKHRGLMKLEIAPQQEETYIKCISFILLQLILKSIELSNYDATGFLIKMFVTNFHKKKLQNDILDSFKEFLQAENKRNPYFKNSIFNEGEINPDFNGETVEYCTYKLTILLYGQQKYAVTYNLPGQEENTIFDFEGYIPYRMNLINCKYVSYLFQKIEKGKDDYGLIFLQDEDFMSSLKGELETSLFSQEMLKNKYW